MFRGKNLFILHNIPKTHKFFCERKNKNPQQKKSKANIFLHTKERK